jgi:hypothetical protein
LQGRLLQTETHDHALGLSHRDQIPSEGFWDSTGGDLKELAAAISTCRRIATIWSELCFFLAMLQLLRTRFSLIPSGTKNAGHVTCRPMAESSNYVLKS